MDSKQKSIKMIDTVKDIVSEICNVPREVMEQRSGKRRHVEARQIAMYVIRRSLNLSYNDILKCFPAIENHTSILYSVRSIDDLMSYDKRVIALVSKAMGEICVFKKNSEDSKKLSHYTIFDGRIAFGVYETEKIASSFVEPNQRIIPVYV